MKLNPSYRVSYRGQFYEAGAAFDIQPGDLKEMSCHGEILDEPAPPVLEPEAELVESKPRRGRPRRAEND